MSGERSSVNPEDLAIREGISRLFDHTPQPNGVFEYSQSQEQLEMLTEWITVAESTDTKFTATHVVPVTLYAGDYQRRQTVTVEKNKAGKWQMTENRYEFIPTDPSIAEELSSSSARYTYIDDENSPYDGYVATAEESLGDVPTIRDTYKYHTLKGTDIPVFDIERQYPDPLHPSDPFAGVPISLITFEGYVLLRPTIAGNSANFGVERDSIHDEFYAVALESLDEVADQHAIPHVVKKLRDGTIVSDEAEEFESQGFQVVNPDIKSVVRTFRINGKTVQVLLQATMEEGEDIQKIYDADKNVIGEVALPKGIKRYEMVGTPRVVPE